MHHSDTDRDSGPRSGAGGTPSPAPRSVLRHGEIKWQFIEAGLSHDLADRAAAIIIEAIKNHRR